MAKSNLPDIKHYQSKKTTVYQKLRQQSHLQIMVIMGMLWLCIFAYLPMIGLVMAFQNYNPFKGITNSAWVGIYHFKDMFQDDSFWRALKNSLGMSSIKLVFSFFSPIIFALMMNEVRTAVFKKTIQTISYLPHFISWVIVAGIFTVWLDARGFMAAIIEVFGGTPPKQGILTHANKFWMTMAIIDTWKEIGWWSTIYMASIVGISPQLYEAAIVDGAGRFQRIWHITLPCIKPTIIILLIMSIGSLLRGGLIGSNFNQSMLFGNALNRPSSELLDTYTLRMGLQLGRLSFATAVGLFQGVISLILFTLANWISHAISGESLY